jgi:hypothetical protein
MTTVHCSRHALRLRVAMGLAAYCGSQPPIGALGVGAVNSAFPIVAL